MRLCDQNLQNAVVVKILGIKIAKDLTWDTNIGDVLGRVISGRLFMLTRLKKFGRVWRSWLPSTLVLCGFFLNARWPFGIRVSQRNNTRLWSVFRRRCAESSWVVILFLTKMPSSFVIYLILEADRRVKVCLDFATKLYESQQFRNWLPLRNSNMLMRHKVRTQRYDDKRGCGFPYGRHFHSPVRQTLSYGIRHTFIVNH